MEWVLHPSVMARATENNLVFKSFPLHCRRSVNKPLQSNLLSLVHIVHTATVLRCQHGVNTTTCCHDTHFFCYRFCQNWKQERLILFAFAITVVRSL